MEVPSRLTDVEAAKIAIGLEENGIAFYDTARKSTRDKEVAELLGHLVQMERRHKDIFEAMEKRLLSREARYWDDPVTTEYIRALLSPGIFPRRAEISKALGSLKNPSKVLDFALAIEKDSVLFCDAAARKAIMAETRDAFSSIADEEKQHIMEIAQLLASRTAAQ